MFCSSRNTRYFTTENNVDFDRYSTLLQINKVCIPTNYAVLSLVVNVSKKIAK